ncbi:ATP-grasp domain-containing protein [Parabacteroides sp. APC149_11_2_Y6]
MEDDIMDKDVLIVGGDGINMLGLVRSFGEMNIKPYIICISPKLSVVSVMYSKYVKKVYVVKTNADCIEKMISLFKNTKSKPAVFTTSDPITYAIDLKYDLLSQYFILSNINNKQGEIVQFMNKDKMSRLAEKFGLRTPVSFIINRNDDITKVNVKYPCITKSILSVYGGKRDVFICNNEVELFAAVKEANSDQLQIQEFIDKSMELIFFGVANKEDIIIPGVAKSLTTTNGFYSGYVQLTPITEQYNEIMMKQLDFVRSCNYTGLFSIEYIVDKEGNCYFMEINIRNDGYTYIVNAAGVNLPYICFQSLIGNINIDIQKVCTRTVVALEEDLDYCQSVKTKKMSFFNWLKRLKNADVLLFYNSQDVVPAIYFIFLKRLTSVYHMLK